jgi:hypothetical protein
MEPRDGVLDALHESIARLALLATISELQSEASPRAKDHRQPTLGGADRRYVAVRKESGGADEATDKDPVAARRHSRQEPRKGQEERNGGGDADSSERRGGQLRQDPGESDGSATNGNRDEWDHRAPPGAEHSAE